MSLSMRGKAAWAALLGLALGTGCSLYVDDIDRTQPERIQKSYFTDGKPWYFRQTVIDVPATANLTFVGEQGGTHKIVWSIDENYLYALRSHEWLMGGEEYAARPGVAYRGTPLAAFRIQSHFDIKRDYNPQTGEQTNVISENSSDRPWYEREYMRVDWSTNLISDFTFVGGYVSQQPVGRNPQTFEDNRDALQVGEKYIDVVHEVVTEPETHDWLSAYYGFPVPTCWLYSAIYTDCYGSRLKVRSSFLKVSEDNIYEPLQYDDHRFDKFGYFRTDRYGYDPAYGIVDDEVRYLIERFNLWKRAPGEPSCKDDTLEHPWANCGNDRIRPIVYYVNENFPESLKEDQKKVMDTWNDAFQQAVSAMTGRPKSQLPAIVVACLNNPVREGDPAECGEPGLRPQIGDLRYSFVYWVPNPQEASPLGYGPHAVDPETGEVISANAFIYGSELETYAQWTLDFVKVINGELTTADMYDGAQIAKHWETVKAQHNAYTMRMTPESLANLAQRLDIEKKAGVLRERIRHGEFQSDVIPGRLERIRNSHMDGVFFPETMRRALAPKFENAADVPAGMERYLSAATLHDPTFMRMHKMREHRLSSNAVCMAEFFDDGMAGWATRLNCKERSNLIEDAGWFDRFCDGTKLKEKEAYEWILKELFVGTALHEVGHCMGLRHNFAGSTDAINYHQAFERDENDNIKVDDRGQPILGNGFWKLREATLGDGETLTPEFLLNGPQADGLMRAQKRGLREYQYSSIMDYGAKPASDVRGLGLWDIAAIKYGYGLMVEVFDRDARDAPPEVARTRGSTTNALLAPGIRHYTVYPDLISANPDYSYKERVASMYKRRTVSEAKVKKDGETLVEVPYRFCSDEYHNGTYFCYRFDQGADAYEQVQSNLHMYENYYVFNGLRRGRVGFGMNLEGYLNRVYGRYFEFLSAQNKHFINDELITRFRDEGCVNSPVPGATGLHFLDPTCGLHQFAAALDAGNALGRVIQTPEPGCYIRLKTGCYEKSYDEDMGIPTDIKVLPESACTTDPVTPSPNYYLEWVKADTPYALIPDSVSCEPYKQAMVDASPTVEVWEPVMDMPLGVGRYSLDKYDREKFGYYFYWKPTTIGAWWDKWLAMQVLGDPYTDFIGVDAQGNARSYLISFNTLFRNQVQNFLGGYITADYNQYAPWVEKTVENKPVLRYMDLLAPLANTMDFAPPDSRPADALPFNPEGDGQYMTRLQAMFIGSMYHTQITDDQDFNQSMLIGKAGSTVDISVPAEIRNDPNRYVEVADPLSGAIYFAVKVIPPNGWFVVGRPFYSIGYEYLKRVKTDFDREMFICQTRFPGGGENFDACKMDAASAMNNELRMMEIMRGLLNQFGYTSGDGFAW